MDPLCHTLVGGCLGQSGLKRRTGLGLATLVIAANLPDVDVLAIPFGRSLAFRRGWTHGVLALAVWPFVLAGLMWLWSRWRARPARPPVHPGQLLLLSAIGVLTHPFLDYLNTYGLRWLMPFRDRWYYGDSLFIVDLGLWLALGLGYLMSRTRERQGRPEPGRPARVALALSALYIGAMIGSTVGARRQVQAALGGDERIMVAPVPIDPFRRQVVVDEGRSYRTGTFRFVGSPHLELGPEVTKGDRPALVRAVGATQAGAAFLHWARFPVFEARQVGDSLDVHVYDLRYAAPGGTSWAALEVRVPGSAPPE